MFVLNENPFYNHYVRHKTHTSIQNKLNGGNSSSSDNRANGTQSAARTTYCRLMFPQAFISNLSSAPGNHCCDNMKHIFDDHTKLTQVVIVR